VSDLFYFDTKPNLKCPTAKTIYIQQRGLSVQAPLRLLLYWRQAQESGFNLWRGLAVTSILASGTTPTTLFWSSDRNRKWKGLVWLIRNAWGTKIFHDNNQLGIGRQMISLGFSKSFWILSDSSNSCQPASRNRWRDPKHLCSEWITRVHWMTIMKLWCSPTYWVVYKLLTCVSLFEFRL
jgi:hypothetical protein